jgi:hypothetical protein
LLALRTPECLAPGFCNDEYTMTSCTTSGIAKALLGLVVALVLLGPAQAAPPASAPGLAAAPFAEGEHWTFSKFIHKYANRAHVVQLCVVCMLLALFIIIKKLDGDGSPRPLPLCKPPTKRGLDPLPSRGPVPFSSAGSRADLTPSSQPREGASP